MYCNDCSNPISMCECSPFGGRSRTRAQADPLVANPLTAILPPWKVKPLDEWRIVGMNHYQKNGESCLFVAMTKDTQCIKEEGADDDRIWVRLRHRANTLK
jgi:hypothetical protein